MKIVDFDFNVINVSLTEPYKLSYVALEFYEVILTVITLNNGVVLTGEVTPLVGYTDESVDSVINDLSTFKEVIINQEIKYAIN